MEFRVSEDCLRLGLRAGTIVFRNVSVGPASEELRTAIAAEAQSLRGRFGDPAEVRKLPEVVAFQDLLRAVNVNPKKYQPSIEKLLLSALKRGELPAINGLVDAYNLVSIRTLCSLGAHDIDRIASPVSLQLLTGDESFTPLGRADPEPVTAGEYGYVDGANRILCRLDVLQAEFSKVTSATTNALLIVEGTQHHTPDELRQAFDQSIELVTRFCGGTAEVIAFPNIDYDS